MALLGTATVGANHTMAAEMAVAEAKLTEVNVPDTTPLIATAVDLASYGYTEREFYVEGTANRYRGALTASLDTATLIDGGHPYKTRVLVRAPEASKFNGTLVVEWANVTLGQDVDFAWAESYDYLMSQGYAFVTLSAQGVGVERLKAWSPERYGDVTVAVDNTDPSGGNVDDCGPEPTCPGDALSWDIMTQASKAVADNAGDLILPGMKVERVIALGESQSAQRLTAYYNTIQPLYDFFDGFVYLDLAGQLRDDLQTPAISVTTESTAVMENPATSGTGPVIRFPPSTTSEYTRNWGVPGTSHSSIYAIDYVDALVLRDETLPSPNGPITFTQLNDTLGCDLMPVFSYVDQGMVLNAAIDAVNRWIQGGAPAAPTLTIERDPDGRVVRDADGMAKGGVRLSQFTVPTAFLSPNGPSVFCVLGGHHRDYTAEELKARYGTHEAYVAQVKAALDPVVAAGYVLQADADAAIKTAEDSDVAR
jgi:hypothetical protein